MTSYKCIKHAPNRHFGHNFDSYVGDGDDDEDILWFCGWLNLCMYACVCVCVCVEYEGFFYESNF